MNYYDHTIHWIHIFTIISFFSLKWFVFHACYIPYTIKRHLIALQWNIVGFETMKDYKAKNYIHTYIWVCMVCVFSLETYYMDLHIFFWNLIVFSFSVCGSPFNFVFKLELFWNFFLIFSSQCLFHSWKYQIWFFGFFFIGLLHVFQKKC